MALDANAGWDDPSPTYKLCSRCGRTSRHERDGDDLAAPRAAGAATDAAPGAGRLGGAAGGRADRGAPGRVGRRAVQARRRRGRQAPRHALHHVRGRARVLHRQQLERALRARWRRRESGRCAAPEQRARLPNMLVGFM